MKKITFILFYLMITTVYSQTVVWSDNFDDLDISDWTITNNETSSDGFDWEAQLESNPNILEEVLKSVSYDINGDVNLAPDNWAISPSIDLSNASGAITLKWKAAAPDGPEFDNENYSVYIATSSVINDLLNGTSMTYNLDGINLLTEQSLDMSSFAGQSTVYIAFRHWNAVPDEGFIVNIDDVVVEAQTVLGIEDVALNELKYWQNGGTKALHFKSPINLSNVELFDTSGKMLLSISDTGKNLEIDTSHLATGAYITRVCTENAYKMIKIVLN
ncbi:T9SS-dependent choice-of-anchor J family protein [Seonamhaeicola aphaedonensis]|nr:choice-of-anchor J domain-containing protein [Seonamhaeicola aphaedonensis]